MTESFGIAQVVAYLNALGLRVASIDERQEMVELAFHDTLGQWRMMIALQSGLPGRQLVFVVPHMGMLSRRQRQACLEALMSLNYTLTVGKFGLDPDDGEIRLTEMVLLGEQGLGLEAFRRLFGALMQTMTIYRSLIPRILYGNLSARAALAACEQEFIEDHEQTLPASAAAAPGPVGKASSETLAVQDTAAQDAGLAEPFEGAEALPPLNADDVLAEITRMLQEGRDQS